MFYKFKKILFLLVAVLLAVFASACSFSKNFGAEQGTKKNRPLFFTTIFPLYDFTKQIVKDKADVSLFLPPGVDIHNFEPSAKEILKASNADVFFYLGPKCELWVDRIYNSIKDKNLITDVTGGLRFLKKDNEDKNIDPHVWLDFDNAEILIDNILKVVSEKDHKNSDFYKNNAEKYKEKLRILDKEFKEVVSKFKIKKIVFASKFAGLYFVRKYGLDYMVAYNSCDEHAELLPKKVLEIINFIKNNKVPAIFYEEPEDLKLAQTISDSTGAKILKFNTLHTVSKEQFDSGVTYLDLMRENLENLKQALV